MVTDIFNRFQLIKPYSISSRKNTLVLRLSSWAKWQKTAQAIADDILVHLNTVTEPSYIIIDLSDSNPNIEDIVILFNTYMRGSKAWIQHPNLKELFLLTHDSILSRTNTYTDSFEFGHLQVRVFHKLETALEFIQQLA